MIKGNWSRAFPAFADKIDRQIDECARALANKKLDEVVAATPVDEGTLASNWRVGINRPNTTFNRASKE